MQPPVFSASPCVIPDMRESSPVDCFCLFFDDRVLKLIFTETTQYVSSIWRGRQSICRQTHRQGRMSRGGLH